MESHKFSVSVPQQLFLFIEKYQKDHHLRTRSEVIGQAIKELQKLELEACYRDANAEIDDGFGVTDGDGL